MLAGRHPLEPGKKIDLITRFRGGGGGALREDGRAESSDADGGRGLPHLRLLCRHVHGQLHELPLSEAIGMALPGNGTIPAVMAARIRAGQGVRDADHDARRKADHPRKIMTAGRASPTPLPWTWPWVVPRTRSSISRPLPGRPVLRWI